jgi:hypothetical protein
LHNTFPCMFSIFYGNVGYVTRDMDGPPTLSCAEQKEDPCWFDKSSSSNRIPSLCRQNLVVAARISDNHLISSTTLSTTSKIMATITTTVTQTKEKLPYKVGKLGTVFLVVFFLHFFLFNDWLVSLLSLVSFGI